MVELLRADNEKAGGDPQELEIEGWILHDLRRPWQPAWLG